MEFEINIDLIIKKLKSNKKLTIKELNSLIISLEYLKHNRDTEDLKDFVRYFEIMQGE